MAHPTRPTPASIARDITIIKAMSRGALRKDVAAQHGLSPNTITYILRRDAPWLLHPHAVDEVARQEKLFYAFAKAAAKARPCIICGYWVFRQANYRTCDETCAAIYQVLRHHINPAHREKVLQSLARSLLRRNVTKQKEWALKMLTEGSTDGKGNYYFPGSRTRRVARLTGLLASEPLPRPYP